MVRAKSQTKEKSVFLVYVDDSSSECYQLMTAVIMPHENFMLLEEYLASVIDEAVPEDQRESFEFHASAMFHSKPPFEGLSHDAVIAIFKKCVDFIGEHKHIRLSYGAINLKALRRGIYGTARPADVAFRLCLKGVEKIFEGWGTERRELLATLQDGVDFELAHHPRYDEFGMLICDQSNRDRALLESFRAFRRRLKSAAHTRGELQHLHDDMYFGDSAFSVGIQLADICGFIVMRHLEEKGDTEHLFKVIEPRICFGEVC